VSKVVHKAPVGFTQDPSPDPVWVQFARKYWKPVYRKRKNQVSTQLAKDSNGNDIWIVEDRHMTEHELKRRVRDLAIRNLRPSWGIVTEEERIELINLEID
jgi:hypothetical protein